MGKKTITLYGVIIMTIVTLASCTFGINEFRNFRQTNSNYQSQLRLNGVYFYLYESRSNSSKIIHPVFLYTDGSVHSGLDFYAIPSYDLKNRDKYENTIEQALSNMTDHYKSYRHDAFLSKRWGIYRVKKDSLYIKYFSPVPSGHTGLCNSKNLILNDTTFVQLNHKCFQGREDNEKRVYRFHKYPFKPDSTYN